MTDRRLCEADLATLREVLCRYIASEIHRGVTVNLALGLCQPFAKTPLDDPMHWLQVNNIFLESDPMFKQPN